MAIKCETPTCVLARDHKTGHRDKDGKWFWEVIQLNEFPGFAEIPHAPIKLDQ